MKKILIIIGIVVLFSFLRVPRASLTDITAGPVTGEAAVVWPVVRYVFEPVVGTAQYLLSFTRYIYQLLSWMGWLGLLLLGWGIVRRKKALRVFGNIGFGWLVLLSFAVAVLLLPLPAPYLSLSKNYSAVDFHSHTFFSHDGVVSPGASIAFHRRLGFDAFFDTEHGHTRGFPYFPEEYKLSNVYPGMQISTTEKISLLVLADREFNGDEYRNKTVQEVIYLAHRNGFVVICPHWWKWRHFTWQQLADMGIDGFEVYNAGYRNFTDAERRQLIQFCQERHLLTTGSTDWHGWGRMTDAWTVLPIAQAKLDAKTLFDHLRARSPTSVLTYRRPEVLSDTRYFFEPFFGIYYYFGSLTLPQLASWIVWLLLAGYYAGRVQVKKALRPLPSILALIFLSFAMYYLIRAIPLRFENQILYRLIAPVCLALAAGWFAAARLLKKTDR